ncbi:putative transcriptional regulator [Desulfosporosinus orientis DSM 765]|uniref:Putative transcriptional regulator n=1 Tax=Desulfosporosinus orientis (strain ATCC 19365 / DSM 765 / NCIMB 8382 / VKM B-1628 / Singapore I) TaxID=768706 RepID=G7WIG0_DESOD|nr:PadR family transcriptional regulator [Desulfosporosinus orientis]AET69034.1 putative transcriptional regulator [Desulfosporosinus orientis DSM 765]
MSDDVSINLELSLSIERSIQAELLLLLGQKPSHGYELIQRLNDAPFMSSEVDTATIYRNLRRMDKDGLIKSHWEVSESGPGRRQYQLTSQGEATLKLWVQYLAQQKARLENFLQAYRDYDVSLAKGENGGNNLE